MAALVAYGERGQRLEERQLKKAARTMRFWQLESDRMTAKLEGMTISEEREFMEMMEIGDKLRDMDGDDDMEDRSGIRKKSSFARKSSMKFKGRLLMATKRVEELGSIK